MPRSGLRRLVPEPVRRTPGDLALVLAYVFLTAGTVFLPIVRETPLRVVVGVPFVLFLPGYAFVSILFPEHPGRDTDDETVERYSWAGGLPSNGIGGLERFATSVGASIAAVVVLGLLIELSPWQIGLESMFGLLALFTILATVEAARRRLALPPEERFRVPLAPWYRCVRDGFRSPNTRLDWALNVGLLLALLAAAWGVGYAPAGSGSGGVTELYLLSEQSDGDFEPRNYPTDVSTGDSTRLVVGVSNREHELVRYFIVAELQYLSRSDSTTSVQRERELRREPLVLAHNETSQLTHNLTLRTTGRYRLSYLLYRGAPPSDPTLDNAYREVHLTFNVSRGGDSRYRAPL